MRQAHNERYHPPVDGHIHAAQPEVAGNVLSSGVPCAKPVGDYRQQWAQAHYQAGMLCVRLCARQGAKADFRLFLPPQRGRVQPRKEGRLVHSLSACARLRRQHHEANKRAGRTRHCHGRHNATLLAKRWESALLVNVDNQTLARLLSNQDALEALSHIEGFRSLNQDIETIINKSEHVKKAKKEGEEKLTPKEKKELSEEEKEYKSKRKEIQEKLIKFATRVPVFMYLTDYREMSLKDVITQLEPGLFKKVTGLNVKDFELLCSLGVFNAPLMNDAIFKFKRYEDSSLSYTGIQKHVSDEVGGWDTVIRREEYERLFYNQQATMTAPDFSEAIPEDFEPVADEIAAADEAEEEAAQTAPTSYAQSVYTTVAKPVEKEDEPDLSAVTVGSVVIHPKFGEGRVVKIDKRGAYIHVAFSVGEKTFANNAFAQGYLKLKE